MDWRPEYPRSMPPEFNQQHVHDQVLHSPLMNNQTGYTPTHITAAHAFGTGYNSSDSSTDGLSGCAGPLPVTKHPAAAAIELLRRASSSTLGRTASCTSGADAAATDGSSGSNATRQQRPLGAAATPAWHGAGRLDAAALKALMAACSPNRRARSRALQPPLEQQHSASAVLEQHHTAPEVLQGRAAAHPTPREGPSTRPILQERAPASALPSARGAPKTAGHAAWRAGSVPPGYMQAAAAAALADADAAQAAADAHAARLLSHSSDPTSAAVGPRPGCGDETRGITSRITSTSVRGTCSAQLHAPADAEQASWPQHGAAPQQQWLQPLHGDARAAGRPALLSPLLDGGGSSRSVGSGLHLQSLPTASTGHAIPMDMQDAWADAQDSALHGEPPANGWKQQQQPERWDGRLAMQQSYSSPPAQQQLSGAARWSTPMAIDRFPGSFSSRNGYNTMSSSSEQFPCSEGHCAGMGPSAHSFPAAGMGPPSCSFPAGSSFPPGSRAVRAGGWGPDEAMLSMEYATSAPCDCWECRVAVSHGRLPPSAFPPPGYYPPNHAAPGFSGRGPFYPGPRFPAQYGPQHSSSTVRLAGPDYNSSPGASYSLPQRRMGEDGGPQMYLAGAQGYCTPRRQQPPSTLHLQDGAASAVLGAPRDRARSLAAGPDSWTACGPDYGPDAGYGPGPVRTKSLPAHTFSPTGARSSTTSRTHPYPTSARALQRTGSGSTLELRSGRAAGFDSNSGSIGALERQPSAPSPVRSSMHMHAPQGVGGPRVRVSSSKGSTPPPPAGMLSAMTAHAVSAGLPAPSSSMQQTAGGAAAAAGGADGSAAWQRPFLSDQQADAAVLRAQQRAGASSSMQLSQARNMQPVSSSGQGRPAHQEAALDGLHGSQTGAAAAAAARRGRALPSSSLHPATTSPERPPSAPTAGMEPPGARTYRQPAGYTQGTVQHSQAPAPLSQSKGPAGSGRTTPSAQRNQQHQHVMAQQGIAPCTARSDRPAAARVQQALPPQEGSGPVQPGAARPTDHTQQQSMQAQTLSTSLPIGSILPAHQPQHQTQQQEPSQGPVDSTADQHTLPGHPLPGQQRMSAGPLTILQGTVVGSTEVSQPPAQAAPAGDAPAASAPAPSGQVATTALAATALATKALATDKQEVWDFGGSMADLLMDLGDEPLNLEEIDSLLSPFDIEADLLDMD